MDKHPRTKLMNLPLSVKGFVCHDDDGEAVIVLNSRMPRETNQKTYDHERKHVIRGDLDNADYLEY